MTTVKSKIREALKNIMSEGDANACEINKGHYYNGWTEVSGWYYRPPNRGPIGLGKNEAEALETIARIEEERDYYRRLISQTRWLRTPAGDGE